MISQFFIYNTSRRTTKVKDVYNERLDDIQIDTYELV